MHKFTKALAAIGLAAVMSQSAMAENLKLGFLVKQPEEPWFQTESAPMKRCNASVSATG